MCTSLVNLVECIELRWLSFDWQIDWSVQNATIWLALPSRAQVEYTMFLVHQTGVWMFLVGPHLESHVYTCTFPFFICCWNSVKSVQLMSIFIGWKIRVAPLSGGILWNYFYHFSIFSPYGNGLRDMQRGRFSLKLINFKFLKTLLKMYTKEKKETLIQSL